MQILFRDLNKDVVKALSVAFHGYENIVVDHASIFDLYYGVTFTADAVISPANCSGNMEGGIDQVYLDHFGTHIQDNLIENIKKNWNSHLPIGEAAYIPTKDPSIPWIISAPTMDWPPGDVSTTSNAYLAFHAALKAAKARNMERILCPGMCTLTGNMNPHVAARQMRAAYNEVMLNKT